MAIRGKGFLVRWCAILLTVGSLLPFSGASAQTVVAPPDSRVVLLPGAPVLIATYTAERTRDDRTASHHVQFKNVSDQEVIAVQFGLVTFDIWNEFVETIEGEYVALLPPQSEVTHDWDSGGVPSFVFTGVAYVNKVRFVSGEVWSADISRVTQEMRRIQADFDPAKLKLDARNLMR